MNIQIREAERSEHDALIALYQLWGYAGGIAADDGVLVAMHDGVVVGLVRACREGGIDLLRGLWIDPAFQRKGIGQQLLAAFVSRMQDRDCYCLPFAHLVAFYRRANFEPVAEHALPAFLAQRLASYRSRGRTIVAMRRSGTPTAAG